jgi:hypothetical protein
LADTTKSSTHETRNRRYLLAKRLGIGAAIAVALFVLVVFVLPNPIARYVIDSQLDGLGIVHEGVETVHIDLWNSQVRAGPIRFRAGDAREGQLGEVAFDYSFGALLRGRGFVSTFIVSGVDVHAARLADGSITLNGVSLTAPGRSDDQAVTQPEPPAENGSLFGVGVEQFEFRDSKLFFEDLSGGSLDVDLERLTLKGFRTWSPDEPTRFTLEGRLNEMQLSISGSLFPLADPLRISVSTHIRGITIERVARFVGPIGLERSDGELETRVQYDYAFHRDGRMEGTVDGTYRLADFHIATPEGEVVTLDEAVLELDLKQTLAADGSASAAGKLRFEGSSLSASTGTGDAIEVGALALNVENLHLTKETQQRRSLLGWTSGGGDSGDGPSGAQSIVALAIARAEALARDFLSHVFEIEGRPTITLTDGLVRLAARGDMPVQEVGFAELEVILGDLESEAFDGGVSGSVSLGTAITGLRATGSGGDLQANVSKLRVDSRGIEVSVTTERSTIAFDLTTVLEVLAASDAGVGSVALRQLSLGSAGISLEKTTGGAQAKAPVVLRLEGLESTLYAEADGDITARGEALELNLPSVTVGGQEPLEASIAGSLEASGLALERNGASPLAFALSSTRTEIESIRIAPLDARATIEGGLTTKIAKFSFGAGAEAGALSGSLESLEHRVEQLKVSGLDGSGPRVALVSRTQADGLEASLPIAAGETVRAAVASLALPQSELALEGRALRTTGDLEVTGITAKVAGDSPQALELATLSVAGIAGDSEAGVAIERIDLGELSVALTLPLPGTPEKSKKSAGDGPAKADDNSADEKEPTPARRRIKVGELRLAPGSKVVVVDKSVKPPAEMRVALEQLKVGPLDSGAPETKTKLALSMALNEASKLSAEGWASPLAREPELALATSVKTLSLIPFSPYAASYTGVNIESGTLWMSADAKTDKGKLDGRIDLRIDDLFVAPISEEEAKALEASTGLPVGFAVGILKDNKGVIELGFPVSGTVTEPKVDYSEAINKAIAGAMASLFPTNWFGADAKSYDMKPATFTPGTTELTAEGKAVAERIGAAFAGKPNISLRACGRAARADLLALRGASGESAPASGEPLPADKPAPTQDAGSNPPAPPELPAPIVAPPSDKEVAALVSLASKRAEMMRAYLSASHGIDPKRIAECRTAYSIEDGKPPRVEFLF